MSKLRDLRFRWLQDNRDRPRAFFLKFLKIALKS